MIPPDANAAFVAGMEDVLEVYQRPHGPACPVVRVDETSKRLVAETRGPVKAKPGRIGRHDYEYERNGTANLFMMFAPLEGWRHVDVTDRHTTADYAHILKDLSDVHFPQASKIVLVQDNLNIHKPASLYEAIPPPEARRLVGRFEWHSPPKHGSWLDMAESELSVLSTQCLDRFSTDWNCSATCVRAFNRFVRSGGRLRAAQADRPRSRGEERAARSRGCSEAGRGVPARSHNREHEGRDGTIHDLEGEAARFRRKWGILMDAVTDYRIRLGIASGNYDAGTL